jgi:protoporphyrinogen oxidase/peptidoglycan/xylan/chitin deacetylase (PgdA/CDA1 family)
VRVKGDELSAGGVARLRSVVVGGGMLGAATARGLAASGRDVVLLEAAPTLGGLASAWSVETTAGPVRWDRFYHVILGQDRRVLDLVTELGLGGTLHFRTVASELLAGGEVHPMSSALDLLRLPALDPVSRVRVGATIALGAVLPIAGGDAVTSARWLRRWSGARATEALWLPLLRAKLGEQAERASARFIRSTFRRLLVARLRGGDGDRFGHVEGGYAAILGALDERLRAAGVDVRTGTAVTGVRRVGDGWRVTTMLGDDTTHLHADEVVLTTPGPVAARLAPELPESYRAQLERVPYLGCVCVSLVLRRPLTGGYLTYVTDSTPYTAVVEMTNLVDAERETGGHALVYLPRYCSPDDKAFDEDDDVIVERCLSDLLLRYPALRREDVLGARAARARHVMPVPEPGRGDDAPAIATGLPGLYLASSAQVVDGTLNVETTLALAEAAIAEVTAPRTPGAPRPAAPTARLAVRDRLTVRDRLAPLTSLRPPRAVAPSGRPTASVSLDADNLWSYLKTHGNPAWEARPGYLSALGPRLIDTWGRHGITATVFVVGHDAATDDGAGFVASLAAAGHEIGNHSYEHEPWLHLYTRDRLEEELARTEDAITAAGAPRPTGFRGPGYSLSPTLLELLEQRGYGYDCSTLPTWIGPLARAYYFRSAKLSAAEREKRQALFGAASEGLRPVGPYRWRTAASTAVTRTSGGLVELPVTTMPGAKIPIHVSYVIHAHQVNPRLARAYVEASLRACHLAGIGPSILLHPLDLLDAADAPGLEFFPGMALPAGEKQGVLDHVLTRLTAEFDVVGTGEHARRLAGLPLRVHDASTAGPRA